MKTVINFIFLGSKITAGGDCHHEIERSLFFGRKAMINWDSILKSRDITFPTKACIVKAMVLSSNHVWMLELDHKEGWAPKNWCFWNAVLEKTLESPLDCKEIKPVNPKGNHFWIIFGRTDAEAPVLWPSDAKSQFIGKDPDAGKGWSKRRRGSREWDGQRASPMQWTWIWANSGRQWRIRTWHYINTISFGITEF